MEDVIRTYNLVYNTCVVRGKIHWWMFHDLKKHESHMQWVAHTSIGSIRNDPVHGLCEE
jgi:hypothetical protein